MAKPEETKATLVKQNFAVLDNALESAFKKCSHLVLNPQKLISVVYSQIKKNPKLSTCNIQSIVVSVLACGELGLYPGHGIHLIPYNNNRQNTVDCHVQLDYKGVCQLFFRHPDATKIQPYAVDKNDEFVYEYGTNEFLRHKPAKEKSGEIVAYYAVAFIKGKANFLVMYPDEIRKHGLRYSKQVDKKTNTFWESSLWATNFPDMAKKTVLLQLSKTLPSIPVEIEKALKAENTERVYDDRFDSVFDMPENKAVVIEGEGVELPEEQPTKSSPSLPPNTSKLEEDVEKIKAKKEDENLFSAEKKKQSTLNFLIDYMKSQGVKIDVEAMRSKPIDEAIAELEQTKKELSTI